MHKSFIAAAATAATLSLASLASAQVIVNEDFESYTDTAELGSTWTLGDGTLDTALGNPGQSLFHPGTGTNNTVANTNTLSFPSVYPGAGETLVFKADIYDDGNSGNERNSAGLRDAAGANIIEMGHYNNPSHYAIRTVLFGTGSDAVYVAFPGIVDDGGAPVTTGVPVVGWHTYTAEITDSNITFSLDLNSDGNINSTVVAEVTQNAAFGFNIIRLGGPSNASSPAGGVNFDNIGLELVAGVIPEPASLGLLGVAGLGLMRRRK